MTQVKCLDVFAAHLDRAVTAGDLATDEAKSLYGVVWQVLYNEEIKRDGLAWTAKDLFREKEVDHDRKI